MDVSGAIADTVPGLTTVAQASSAVMQSSGTTASFAHTCCHVATAALLLVWPDVSEKARQHGERGSGVEQLVQAQFQALRQAMQALSNPAPATDPLGKKRGGWGLCGGADAAAPPTASPAQLDSPRRRKVSQLQLALAEQQEQGAKQQVSELQQRLQQCEEVGCLRMRMRRHQMLLQPGLTCNWHALCVINA